MGGKSSGKSRSYLWWPLSGANRGVEGRALGRGEGGWVGGAGRGGDVGRDGDVRRGRRGMDAGRGEGAAEGQAGGQVCGPAWPGLARLTPPRRVGPSPGLGT